MTENELIEAVESLGFDPEQFDHETHVRFAWGLLRADPVNAERRIRDGIRRFATHAGAPGKYDDALTLTWIARIRERMEPGEEWAAFRARTRQQLKGRAAETQD